MKGFEALYAKAWSGPEWLCDFLDAQSVAHLGHTTAFRQRRYADAVRHLRELRKHPGWHIDSDYTLEVWEGCAEILSGGVAEGIARWDSVLIVDGYHRVTRYRLLLGSLMTVVDETEDLTPLLPLLREFLGGLVASHPKLKRMVDVVEKTEARDDLRQTTERAFVRLR